MVCGTVNSYKYEILKIDSLYLIQRTTNANWTGGNISTQIIDTITNKKFNDIYFVNRSNILEFDDNNTYPIFLIFEKDSKYTIYDNDTQFIYDAVELRNHLYKKLVLIKKGGLSNYYHISSKVKYKRLDDFYFHLAYFELPNGKSGYLDIYGNEYFK